MNALEIAINVFRRICTDEEGPCFGVELIDAHYPILEAWDSERELSLVVAFFATDEERAKAERMAIIRATDGYRNFRYACGVIPAVCGPDEQIVELDWLPSEADNEAYETAREKYHAMMQAQLELMKVQGLWPYERRP